MVSAVRDTGFSGPICIEDAAFQGWEGIERAAAYTQQLRRTVFGNME